MTFSSIEATAEFSKFAHLDKHDGLTTHLEPDILECEVKWEGLRKYHYE